MISPKFKIRDNDASSLNCPICDEEYLHQNKTEIFERAEDEENGLHVIVNRNEIKMDKNLNRNPSSRRNGLKITFWCESCQKESVLNIVQHKGTTWIYFEEETKNE
jgi:hypothetical protein